MGRWIAFAAVVAGLVVAMYVSVAEDNARDPAVARAAPAPKGVATRRTLLAAEGTSARVPREDPAPAVEPTPATEMRLPVEPAPPPPHDQIARWVQDLASDDVPGNADDAYWNLYRAKDAACPALENALYSRDPQQRFFAARLLCAASRRRVCEASPRLYEVCVEALRDDRHEERLAPFLDNATESARFLIHEGERAWTYVLPALTSRDRQQRFLAAVVLGYAECPWNVDAIAAVLGEHMHDDATRGNAVIAASAMARLGPSVAPAALDLTRRGDRQASELATIVLLDLEQPPRTAGDWRARREMHSASTRLSDPAQLNSRSLFDWIDQLEDRLPGLE